MKYIVKKGDNLSRIAKAHGTTVDAIAKANNIKNVNLINVGQVLTIPTTTAKKPTAEEIIEAFDECLTAIENLPEFKVLEEMLNG